MFRARIEVSNNPRIIILLPEYKFYFFRHFHIYIASILPTLLQVVKQRMQMAFSPYGSSLECVRCIYRREGFVAFYRSYTTQLTLNVPFQTCHFVTYEFVQQVKIFLFVFRLHLRCIFFCRF